MRSVALISSLLGLLPLAGCGPAGRYLTEERLAHGLVIILPGIEGESQYNHDIQRGLVMANINRALTIYSWGRPVPIAGLLLNQMDVIGNRLAGVGIANMIVRYQESHPGRPVHIIGHSGGGGVAVFAAEALPPDRKVDGLILLSASISNLYDLTTALSHCRNGIVSFYSREDVGLLVIGTTIAGNVDGIRGPAAGAVGFQRPGPSAAEEKKAAYAKLFEVPVGDERTGGDAHTAATRVGFVWSNVAPWVRARSWPATGSVRSAQLPVDVDAASSDSQSNDGTATAGSKSSNGAASATSKSSDGTVTFISKDR